MRSQSNFFVRHLFYLLIYLPFNHNLFFPEQGVLSVDWQILRVVVVELLSASKWIDISHSGSNTAGM